MNFEKRWITQGADEQMIAFAEENGKFMRKNDLATSRIRSIYGELKRIQMKGYDKEKVAFLLLRPKVAYALGREPQNEGLKRFKGIFDDAAKNVSDEKSFTNFCNLMEAILAYHKASGGK